MPAAREASEGDVGLFTLLHSMVLPHIPSLSAFPPLFTPSPRRCFVHKMGTEQEQRLPGFAALSQRGFQGFCRSRLGPGHLLPPPNPAIRHPAHCLPQASRC